ncbi:MAG: FtsQ-type POTRA domain-containing protein [Bacteroidota bacterium]
MKQPRPKKRQRLWVGGAVMAGLVAVVIAVTFGANLWKHDLRVAYVRTAGNRVVSSEEILRSAAIKRDTRLFDVDLFAVEERVRKNHFFRSVSVNRNAPDAITIAVVERTPVAVLPGENLLTIDDEGMVLPYTASEYTFDLPVLTGLLSGHDLKPGRHLSSETVREALSVLAVAREIGEDAYRRISELHFRKDGELILFTSERGIPVLFGRGEVVNKLIKLDGFWKEIVSRRGPQDLVYVDVRFTDQVVVRWN